MHIIAPSLWEKLIRFAGGCESAAPLVYYCMLLKIGLTYYKHDAKIFESEFCTSS